MLLNYTTLFNKESHNILFDWVLKKKKTIIWLYYNSVMYLYKFSYRLLQIEMENKIKVS